MEVSIIVIGQNKLLPMDDKIGTMSSPVNFASMDTSPAFYHELLENISQESAQQNALDLPVQPIFLQAFHHKNPIGGIAAFEFYGSIMIDILWVNPEFRNQGIGSKLLKEIEEIAQKKHLKFITVSTMSFWNVSKFYKKHGFRLEGERKGYAKNFSQFHYIKTILRSENGSA